jgi:hypothetical protein
MDTCRPAPVSALSVGTAKSGVPANTTRADSMATLLAAVNYKSGVATFSVPGDGTRFDFFRYFFFRRSRFISER